MVSGRCRQTPKFRYGSAEDQPAILGAPPVYPSFIHNVLVLMLMAGLETCMPKSMGFYIGGIDHISLLHAVEVDEVPGLISVSPKSLTKFNGPRH